MTRFAACLVLLGAMIPGAVLARTPQSMMYYLEVVDARDPKKIDYVPVKATFVDFVNTTSEIVVDFDTNTVKQKTTIELVQKEAGLVVFDLVTDSIKASLDGRDVTVVDIETPSSETTLKVVKSMSSAGRHTLVVESQITRGVEFDKDAGFSLLFKFSDLTDRQFLEQYLPSNLQYDQYAQKIRITAIGATVPDLSFFSNGKVETVDNRSVSLSFPEYYNCTATFLHVVETRDVEQMKADFPSASGKTIPIAIYRRLSSKGTLSLMEFMYRAVDSLNSLELRYGVWPHEQLLVYALPGNVGGMEYSGATFTSLWALNHELAHSYNARWIFPQDGNSGWLDEALARWRDLNHPSSIVPPNTESGFHLTDYYRLTNYRAYTDGERFLAYLNYRFMLSGKSFLSFVRHFFDDHGKQTVTNKMFQKDVEAHAGESFSKEFSVFFFGTDSVQSMKGFSNSLFGFMQPPPSQPSESATKYHLSPEDFAKLR